MTELIINFDNPPEKAMILDKFRGLKGRYRLTMKDVRPRRSDRQNRYYWPAFVQPFGDFMRGQGYGITDDDAHEILKQRFNSRSVIDKRTGEVVTFACSTTKLSTKEFNEYLDRCAAFLADFAGIVVGEPGMYHEVEEKKCG